jgi:transposase
MMLFLPPYSPDMHKIEKIWVRLKHDLRYDLCKTLKQFENLWDAVDNAFEQLS